MRIALSGSRGFIGSALARELQARGHQVLPLQRGVADKSLLSQIDAVIHLSGKPIAGLWTSRHLKQAQDSRVNSTHALAQALAELRGPCKTYIVASAVGYYGHRPFEALDESSQLGEGILPKMCQAWEAAAQPARDAGLRVVHARLGMVLGKGGGALKPMLPAFRLGLGGRLGSGQQVMSWIGLRDAVQAFCFLLENESLRGPVNFCSPQPVWNREFTRALAAQLRRPAFFHAPAFALKLALGSMADEMLLCSQQVYPKALSQANFKFLEPSLAETIKGAI